MTEVRKRTGKKDEKSIKTEKSNGPESDSKSKVIQIVGLAIAIGLFYLMQDCICSDIPKDGPPQGGVIASAQKNDVKHFSSVKCSDEYSKKPMIANCSPTKCGRMVLDGLLTDDEIATLTNLAEKGTLVYGGGSGAASILELYSSTVSMQNNFVSLFAIRDKALKDGDEELVKKIENIYSKENLDAYSSARKKVQDAIGQNFGIDSSLLHLAQPTFFSRLTSDEAKTPHDEYWHQHVDTNQYQTFDYTALIYLNQQSKDYEGGRFIFDPSPLGGIEVEQKIEPIAGRASAFTSGAENPHRVEKVEGGVRLAFTMGFTCNPEFAINDPKLP